MPFDQEKWSSPADHSDVGGVALELSVALGNAKRAFAKIQEKSGIDLSEEIAEISRIETSCFDNFTKLTGWTET